MSNPATLPEPLLDYSEDKWQALNIFTPLK